MLPTDNIHVAPRTESAKPRAESGQRTAESRKLKADWAAVLHRDPAADGRFVYAVSTTGIFCRPSCPSRRPRPDRVRFFPSAAEAIAAGFRACKRCHPTTDAPRPGSDDRVRRAAAYIGAHADERVSLATLARVSGFSAFHLQRRFKRALGISPREYQAACRAERFRHQLRHGKDVATATYEAGYGSPSRVYDAVPTGSGMTPATYRRGGAGAHVGFVTVRTPLGLLLVAGTARGICAVKLGDSAACLESELRREFAHAVIVAGAHVKSHWVRSIVNAMSSGMVRSRAGGDLPLDVRGTAFQWRVWRALQNIAPGETRSYSDVAHLIGRPAAVRAVARACATNPVCLVIPCHRVVSKNGAPGGYRWGAERKVRLLQGENAGKREVKK